MKELDMGGAKAFLFRLGNLSKAYVYLQEDDSIFSEVKMTYSIAGGNKAELIDKEYPFEFTVDLPSGNNGIQIQLEGVQKNGKKMSSTSVVLGLP